MDKTELKKYIIQKRKSISDDEVLKNSIIISEKLTKLEVYKTSEIILCYAGYNHEVMTDGIIKDGLSRGKKVALPKVRGREMDFYYINSLSDLKPGYMSIPEPAANVLVSTEEVSKALMVIPGTSFDRNFNRNGYGGGYYDRYIEKNPPKCIVGIAFEFQIFDNIPNEEHDKKADYIISEVNVYGK